MGVSPGELGDMDLWTYGAARSEWNRRHKPPEDKPPTPDQMEALKRRMREMMPDVKE